MAGTSVYIPAALAGYSGGDIATADPSLMNSFRISEVAARLLRLCAQPNINEGEFRLLCFSFARGIDYSTANQEVPTNAPEFPSLLKQVCQRKYEPSMQAALMVLLTSIKSACQVGWFSEKDSEDLRHLANEISGNFCSATDFKSEPSGSQSIISTIMKRFFPKMKMGQILAFLEVKPGYGAFMDDFHLLKNVKNSPEETIRLLVAQIDNMETSSCLISPSKVNFLINGCGVAERTNPYMDTGPQVPTLLSNSNMLKYGTNLLQAVGEFNGNYIIVVAYMSMMSTPDPTTLLNYLQPDPASKDPESDIIEGPSRISLNCPISFKRIKTPVKGHSCKHLQCFDYDNYVDINSRRPSWRCPHCNQPVCFTDIRIDQDFVKVLKEVEENATHVNISSDASWKAIAESDDHNHEKTSDKFPESAEGERVQPYSGNISNEDILDLTTLDDEMDEVVMGENVDQKSFQTNCQSQPQTSNVNHTSNEANEFRAGVYFSTYGLRPSCSTSNPAITNEYGTFPSIISHSTTPVTVQSIPVISSQQRPRNSMNSMMYGNGPSATCQDSPASTRINMMNPVPFSLGMQEQFSMSNTNMLQPSCLPSSTSSNIEMEQRFTSVHPSQQFPRFATEPQNFSQPNQRASYVTNNSQGLTRPSASYLSQTGLGQARGAVSSQHGQSMGAVQQSSQTTPGQDWRPTTRMRGSLSGQAYANALEHYIVRPTQQAQLEALIANRVFRASPMANANHSSTG